MFEDLSTKFHHTFKKLTHKGVLSETNISASLKEVKMALLEADVNYRVVSSFLKSVKKRALGTEVLSSLSPGQQFIKIVNEELNDLMGKKNVSIQTIPDQITVIMLVGLQGSGKTTTVAKLANRFKKEKKSSFLVPVDIYRPAAIEQLKTLAGQLEVSCFNTTQDMKPVSIVKQAFKQAAEENADFMILDTAGRLHIDETLMQELKELKNAISVHEILFVADAMTGQEAVNVAKTFHETLDVTGFILTKMDGDARGGAALSMRAITGQPIKFVGVGEKITDLDPFYPDRISSKILGMGDLLSLIEKAQENFDEVQAKKLEQRIRKNQFNLSDFQIQLRQIKKMGSISDLLGMIPGMGTKKTQVDETLLQKIEAILSSMTLEERNNHNLLNASRKIRISKGSGTQVSDINKMLKQFLQMKKMMKKFSSMGEKRAMSSLKNMLGNNPF